MTVKRKQIPQLIQIIIDFVPAERLPELFERLKRIEAYDHNLSYRKTIERLEAARQNKSLS